MYSEGSIAKYIHMKAARKSLWNLFKDIGEGEKGNIFFHSTQT